MEERQRGGGGESTVTATQPETKARRPLEGTGIVAALELSCNFASSSRSVSYQQATGLLSSKQPSMWDEKQTSAAAIAGCRRSKHSLAVLC